MVRNKLQLYVNKSRKDKSVQKKYKYYIIDQKSRTRYKKYISSIDDIDRPNNDTNSVITPSRRSSVIKPNVKVVSKIDCDIQSSNDVTSKDDHTSQSSNDSSSESKVQLDSSERLEKPLLENSLVDKQLLEKLPKKMSKWQRSRIEYLKAQEDRTSDIKAMKTLKRKLRKNRINTAKLLTKKTKKGQPVMKNVMKHLLNKLQS